MAEQTAVNGSLPWLTEDCFQLDPLQFAGNSSWLHHTNGTRYEIPLVKVANGTTPKGSVTGRFPFGRGSDNDYAEGCDHHLYCSYCNPQCQGLLNENPEGKYVAFTNVGPHAMRLLTVIDR